MMENNKNINDDDDRSVLIINKGEEPLISDDSSNNNNKVHIISLTTVMVIGFIANVEYGIVMPSLLGYLESMNGNSNSLGWALAVFSIAQVVFLPIVGLIADKRTMKESFIACLIIGVIGNVVYAMAVNPTMVIMGRFIAGIGSSNMALTNSYIAAVSTKEQRTKFMGIVNGINAFGLVAGPAFNLGIGSIDFSFYIGKIHFIFDPLRTPGWFLAILLFLVLLSFFWFKEPIPITSESVRIQKEQQDLENNNYMKYQQIQPSPPSLNEKKSLLHKSTSHPALEKYSEITLGNDNNVAQIYSTYGKYPISQQHLHEEGSLRYRLAGGDIENAPISSTMITPQSSFSHFSSRKFSKGLPSSLKAKKEPSFIDNFKKISDVSLLTCFVINFVQNFVFGALETMITPITQQQYGFKTLQNSIMYSLVSLEIIVFIILTVIFTGRGAQDKHAIMFGMLFLGAGLILLMVFFGLGLAVDSVPMWKFILSVAILTVGIPTQNTSVYSLYSKLLNKIYGEEESQGFSSGFMMVMGSAARILGPLWAGYGLAMVRRLPLFIVLIAMWIFDICIVLLFWKRLTFKFDPNAKTTTIVSH